MFGTSAHATVTKVDASKDTISCDTLEKGAVKFSPSLLIGGATPSTAKLKGTISGCSVTPDVPADAVDIVSGTVSGTLSSGNNNCLALLGPSGSTGTITITWKTAKGEALLNNKTVITVSAGNVSGGTANPFGDAATYGAFNISGTTQTGAFSGSDMGASSTTHALTVEGVGALTAPCTATGLKGVNLGSTETNLG
jgi:hypothetical protein